jgi:serine/threonine protein kinase
MGIKGERTEYMYRVKCWSCKKECQLFPQASSQVLRCTCGADMAFRALPVKANVLTTSLLDGVYRRKGTADIECTIPTSHNQERREQMSYIDVSNADLTRNVMYSADFKALVPLHTLISELEPRELADMFQGTRGVESALFHPLPVINEQLRSKICDAQVEFGVQACVHDRLPNDNEAWHMMHTAEDAAARTYVVKRLVADKALCKVYEVGVLDDLQDTSFILKCSKDEPTGNTSVGQLAVLKDLQRLLLLNTKREACTGGFSAGNLDFIPKLEAIGSLHPHFTFFVMENVEGITLEQLVRYKYPDGMPAEVALRALKQITLKLHFLHSMGFIHGDINPRNIMIGYCEHKQEVVVKFIDYSEMVPFRYFHIERNLKNGIRNEVMQHQIWHWPGYGDSKSAVAAVDLYPLGACLQLMLLGEQALECELGGEGFHGAWHRHVGSGKVDGLIADLVQGLLAGGRLSKPFGSAQAVLFRIDSIYRAFENSLESMSKEQRNALRKGYGAKSVYRVHSDTSLGDYHPDFEQSSYINIVDELDEWQLRFFSRILADRKMKLRRRGY